MAFKDSAGAVLYRIAYARTRDRIARRQRAYQPVEDLDAMRTAIRLELGVEGEGDDPATRILRGAVEDALAGRRPRW